MTIKLFCKQIEVVDYESFSLYQLLLLHWCIACLVPLNFLSLGSTTQAIIQYTLYLILLYLY